MKRAKEKKNLFVPQSNSLPSSPFFFSPSLFFARRLSLLWPQFYRNRAWTLSPPPKKRKKNWNNTKGVIEVLHSFFLSFEKGEQKDPLLKGEDIFSNDSFLSPTRLNCLDIYSRPKKRALSDCLKEETDAKKTRFRESTKK